MYMKSQELRKLAPELDSLRLGSGWSIEDLSKPAKVSAMPEDGLPITTSLTFATAKHRATTE